MTDEDKIASYTTISVKPELKEKIKEEKKASETYGDYIERKVKA